MMMICSKPAQNIWPHCNFWFHLIFQISVLELHHLNLWWLPRQFFLCQKDGFLIARDEVQVASFFKVARDKVQVAAPTFVELSAKVFTQDGEFRSKMENSTQMWIPGRNERSSLPFQETAFYCILCEKKFPYVIIFIHLEKSSSYGFYFCTMSMVLYVVFTLLMLDYR